MGNEMWPGNVLDRFLTERPSVGYLRLVWVDLLGTQHSQILTRNTALQMAAGRIDYFTTTQGPTDAPEVWELRLDWMSLKPCGFSPRYASVMCYEHLRGAAQPLARCSRTLLQRVARDFQQQYSTQILVGFKARFIVLEDSPSSVDRNLDPISGGSTMSGLRGDKLLLMEEIVETAEAAGVEIRNFHTEDVNQLVITLAPLPPTESVDALMYLQEAIQTVCVRRGVSVSLNPRPIGKNYGNLCHTTISIHSSHGLRGFLAGVLSRFEGLCGLGMPTIDSYTQTHPRSTTASQFDKAEKPCVPVQNMGDNSWELQFVDPTANLYLFLAALLSAGSNSMSATQACNEEDARIMGEDLPWDVNSQHAASRCMPKSLQSSLDALAKDKKLAEWVGEDMHADYMKKRSEEVRQWLASMEYYD